MNKQYKASPVKKWVFLIYIIIPLFRLYTEGYINPYLIIEMILYLFVAVFFYLYHKRKVIIEIKDNVLHFYEGVGMHDLSSIEITRIDKLKRESRNLLAIGYDGNKTFSVEAPKFVLDALTRDLESIKK